MSVLNFTVYSKEGCPYCDKVVELFAIKGFSFVEYKLEQDFDKAGFEGQFGKESKFPQVTLNGQNLGGCSDTINYLKENQLV